MPTQQARQNRLQHLTTQLLWRLQQSSPFHSPAAAKLVPPVLPDASSSPLASSPRPVQLLPGLAESRGALYEIGVADNGGFVGLARDEMDESVANLMAMASSLGCTVEIRRVVLVGECSWHDYRVIDLPSEDGIGQKKGLLETGTAALRSESLWVAEAFVSPETSTATVGKGPLPLLPLAAPATEASFADGNVALLPEEDSHTEQLRVALTGATAAGKSSLLGTLSSSRLDNGRGKSRVSLFRHQHEIRSGRTSSVALELLGYRPREGDGDADRAVVNYSLGNVSSWNDIHHEAAGGRLVFFIDSAGHQPYKRTMIRSLVSWEPHWVACCVAADAVSGVADEGLDLSKAHMDLCLRLNLPLFVVVTKVDVAVASLRPHLSDLFTILRAAGRVPTLLSPGNRISADDNFRGIRSEVKTEVRAKLSQVTASEQHKLVPFILTSAVSGAGVSQLHSLLRELSLPIRSSTIERSSPATPVRFHVDEFFVRSDRSSEHANITASMSDSEHPVVVLSGLLRQGHLSIGNDILLGPFPTETLANLPSGNGAIPRARSYPTGLGTSHISSPIDRLSLDDPRRRSGDFALAGDEHLCNEATAKSDSSGEWLTAHVISVRNLRLPLRTLLADQAGTVGIALSEVTAASKLRKGMLLIDQVTNSRCEGATTRFRARFPECDYRVMEPGATFQVLIASFRAQAKIRTVAAVGAVTSEARVQSGVSEDNGLFDLETEHNGADVNLGVRQGEPNEIEVAFQFMHNREWVEVGTQAVVMPWNTVEGSVGLDAFVGQVTAIEP